MNDRLETLPTPEPPRWSSPETLHVLVAGSAALRRTVSETLADSTLLVSTADDITDGTTTDETTVDETTADGTVELDAERELDLDSDSESQPNCLLTDDPSLLPNLPADEFTIVVVSDSAGDIDIDTDADTDTDTTTNTDSPVAGDSPSVEFISRETVETQSLLEHRLRRAVEFSAVQRLQSGQAEWYRSL